MSIDCIYMGWYDITQCHIVDPDMALHDVTVQKSIRAVFLRVEGPFWVIEKGNTEPME